MMTHNIHKDDPSHKFQTASEKYGLGHCGVWEYMYQGDFYCNHKFLISILLHWRHNQSDGISNHQRLKCLLHRLFRRRSKKTSKLRVTGLCEGNPPVTGGFPSQRASNAEMASIWWRHHDRWIAVTNLWSRTEIGNSLKFIENRMIGHWPSDLKILTLCSLLVYLMSLTLSTSTFKWDFSYWLRKESWK